MGRHQDSVQHALNQYLQRMGNFRQQGTTQLSVAYGRQCKGEPISKQRLYHWLVECIKYSHSTNEPPTPVGVKGHHTRMALTYADMGELTPSPYARLQPGQTLTFARFYRLDAIAYSMSEFGRRVLTFADHSTSAPHQCIPQKHYFSR